MNITIGYREILALALFVLLSSVGISIMTGNIDGFTVEDKETKVHVE